MAIPAKGVNNIRTLSGRVAQVALPYRSYMQITCLEMEKARRGSERISASHRIAKIDARLQEIEKEKAALLETVNGLPKGPAWRGPNMKSPPRRSAGAFKIRY